VKLLTFVFHFFHAWLKYLSALVTSRGKSLIVTLATVQRLVLGPKGLVDQGQLAHMTKETLFVPVLFLIGQVL
jgi:ABC-type glycerol-3-phosphate transport system permease component